MSRPIRAVPGVRRYALPGGAALLLHPDRQRLFLLNETAHFLWRMFERFDCSRLPSKLASRFAISADQAQRDVGAVLAEWQASGLLEDSADETQTRPITRNSGVLDQTMGSERFRVGTAVVSVRAPASLLRSLMPLWGHLRTDVASPDLDCLLQVDEAGAGSLTINGVSCLDGLQAGSLVGALYRAILEHLYPATRWSAMIHAGAVANNGNALIISAPSGFGKSTLVAYLVARGFEYLSDDLAALTHDGSVTPFPLPISVKSGAAPALAPFYSQIDAAVREGAQYIVQNADFLGPARPAKALLFPKYLAGATTRFEKLKVENALASLLNDQIFFGYPIGETELSKFLRWLCTADLHALTYSRFEEAELCIRQMMQG